jgi:hypothetical protein
MRRTAQLGQLDSRPGEEIIMKPCPHKNCKFKTNKTERLQHHLKVSGHGHTDSRKKEFKGYLDVRGKKKSKAKS